MKAAREYTMNFEGVSKNHQLHQLSFITPFFPGNMSDDKAWQRLPEAVHGLRKLTLFIFRPKKKGPFD
jgi:hypothetical protein